MSATLKDIRHICAVVTPFKNVNGQSTIDYPSHHRHIEWLEENGVDAIVSLGTTGESPTVSFEEHEAILDNVGRSSRLPVIAGAGANSTDEAIRLTKHAEKSGAIAILSVVPYYNKPPQEGLFQHYVKICKSTSLPVLLYNVPGRTVIDLKVETVLRIRDACPNFAGIKEASNNLKAVQQYVLEGVPVFCGEDALNYSMLALGAQGVISVVSNFAPDVVTSLFAKIRENEVRWALHFNDVIADLADAAFIEANPIPTKFICSKLGFCENTLRLPLVPLTAEREKTVLRLVKKHMKLDPIK